MDNASNFGNKNKDNLGHLGKLNLNYCISFNSHGRLTKKFKIKFHYAIMVKFRLLNTTFHHCVLLSITKYFVTLQKLNFLFAIGLN